MKRDWEVLPDPELEAALLGAIQNGDAQAVSFYERMVDDSLKERLAEAQTEAAAILHNIGGVLVISSIRELHGTRAVRKGYLVRFDHLTPVERREREAPQQPAQAPPAAEEVEEVYEPEAAGPQEVDETDGGGVTDPDEGGDGLFPSNPTTEREKVAA